MKKFEDYIKEECEKHNTATGLATVERSATEKMLNDIVDKINELEKKINNTISALNEIRNDNLDKRRDSINPKQ